MPSAASGNAVTVFQAEAQSTPRAGVWTHLAASYDSEAQRIDLYIDGDSDGMQTDVTPFNDPQGSTWIGRSNDSWFAGSLADVNVWFRALSEPEIEAVSQSHDPMNGAAAAGPTPVTSPQWNATGKFTVGQAWWNGAAGQSVTGDVDDVLAFQEALGADDVSLLMKDELTFGSAV